MNVKKVFNTLVELKAILNNSFFPEDVFRVFKIRGEL